MNLFVSNIDYKITEEELQALFEQYGEVKSVTILKDMEIIPVKNVDEVLKVALTKSLKRVEWVEVEAISKKEKVKEELSTH